MKALILTAAAIALGGMSATAQTARYSATLASPLSGKKDFVVNGNAWRCDGLTCLLVSTPNDPYSVHSCHELMRLAGAVTAYGGEGRSFDADKLAKCNAKG
jgi:hypothetical protein